MLSIFNYSVKKLWNLESRFSNSDTSWKNNTSIILVETLRMVIYLSKYLLKTHFSLFEIKKKWFLSEKKQGQGKGSCLTLKSLAKLSPRIQKLYHITHIFCNTVICLCPILWYQVNGTKRNPWVAVYLQNSINYSNDTSILPLTL